MSTFLDTIYNSGLRVRYEATFEGLLENGDAIIKNIATPLGMVFEEYIIPASENKEYPKPGKKFAFLANLQQRQGYERMIYDFVRIKFLEIIKYSEDNKNGISR